LKAHIRQTLPGSLDVGRDGRLSKPIVSAFRTIEANDMVKAASESKAGKDRDGQEKPKDRDLRLREQFFPDAAEVIFDTSQKGYGPLPIMLRKLLRHMTAPELRVLIYLYTRSGKYRLCYPTLEEMAEELGLNRKNLTQPLKNLEKKRLISTHSVGGRKYFLVHDPRVSTEHLVQAGEIKGDELFMINELARELEQHPFKERPKAVAAAKA